MCLTAVCGAGGHPAPAGGAPGRRLPCFFPSLEEGVAAGGKYAGCLAAF